MNTKTNLILFLLGMLVISCNKDDSSCSDTIYLGDFTPTEKSLSTIPYRENTTVVFADSLGEIYEFKVAQKPFRMLHWSIPGTCPTNYYQEVAFEHGGGLKEYILENDTSGIVHEVGVLSLQYFDNHKIYDELTVTYGIVDSGYYQTINHAVDQRLLRDVEFENLTRIIALEESRTFFGKTFKDVYHEKYKEDTFMFKTYYNYEQGIVSFRDGTGKRWVFKEIIEN